MLEKKQLQLEKIHTLDYGEWVRYDDKSITQGEVEKLYAESELGDAPQMIWRGRFIGSILFGGPKAQSSKRLA